ncbi:MAG: hypothetical protein WD066_17775 [Planctomycetaceae bacterium]
MISRPDRLILAGALLLTTAFGSQRLPAQEAASPPEPPAVSSSGTGAPGDDTAGGAATDAGGPDVLEKLIYVPYQNVRAVVERQKGTVFLPYLEYLRLWQRSEAAGAMDAAPVEAVITEAHYKATIEKDQARISATLTVRVLRKPWAEVPVRFGKAAVGKVTGGDEDNPVILRGTGDGTYSLLLPTKGEHQVELELIAAVHTSPDGRSLQLEIPPVGITTFELIVPEAQQTVELEPKLVTLPVEGEADRTHVKASLGSTRSVNVTWRPEAGLRPEMDLLANVENDLSVSIADGLVHTAANLAYRVLRGDLTQAQIAVPKGHRILDVTARDAAIKGWKTEDEENRRLVTVELLAAVRKEVTFEIRTEAPQPAGAFDVAGIAEDGTVHGIHAAGVVRESGRLVVTRGDELTLTVENQQGVMRVDAAEFDQNRRRANAEYYRFYGPQFTLRVEAKPVEPRLVVAHTTRLVFGDDELRLFADLRYEIDRAGVFSLALKIPEGLTIDDVASPMLERFDVTGAGAERTLNISLNGKQQGALLFRIVGHLPLEPDGEGAEPGAEAPARTLPILEPLGVERETGDVLVFAPPGIEVVTDPQALAGLYAATGPPQVQELGGIPQGDAQLVSAWSYNRRPVSLVVKTARRPTRLSARVGTTVRVRQELTEVSGLVEFAVEYAGIDTFRIAVPEAVADRTQIESISGGIIKQRTRAEQADEGWVTWTIVMQRDVLGPQRFQVTWDVPRAAQAAAAGAEEPPADADAPADAAPAQTPKESDAEWSYLVRPPRALSSPGKNGGAEIPLTKIDGELLILRDRALAVSAAPTGDALEPIDVRELDFLSVSGELTASAAAQQKRGGAVSTADAMQTAVLAYRYHSQPVELTISARRYEIGEVVETVVSKALVEVVIGRDGARTYSCRYRLTSSERQRLAIDLPAKAQPLAVLIDGRGVLLGKAPPPPAEGDAPRSDWDSYFVDVSRGSQSDDVFLLTLRFRFDDVPALEGSGGRVSLELPRIGGSRAGTVVVQQSRLAVWVPDDFALVDTPEGFTSRTIVYPRGWWLGPLGTRVSHASGYHAGLGPDNDQWIADATGGGSDFPTEGHAYLYAGVGLPSEPTMMWWNMPFYTWVVSGALVLIAVVLRNTTWENKLGIVVLAAVAAALFAQWDAPAVAHVVFAGRYGLAALAVLWIVHALFARGGPHEALPSSTSQPDPTVVPPTNGPDEPYGEKGTVGHD